MKVTKADLDSELQSHFRKANALKPIFQYKLLTKIFNKVVSLSLTGKKIDGLECDEFSIPSSDGRYQIRTRSYRPVGVNEDLPVLVYCHGGGYLAGSPELSHELIERFVRTRPCMVIAPDYRKSYVEPFPAGFNDCYDTLLWVKSHSQALRVSAEKIIVAGHSAGGGLTAAVTLKARDTGDVSIAFQMPIYPMIDDQQPGDKSRDIEAPVWDSRTNRTAWNVYLKGLHARQAEVPAYAAPARNTDYAGFPPTITLVATLDPFYTETNTYVQALQAEGIEVAFDTFEGGFHGFEVIAPDTKLSKAVLGFTFDKYAEFYDRYIDGGN